MKFTCVSLVLLMAAGSTAVAQERRQMPAGNRSTAPAAAPATVDSRAPMPSPSRGSAAVSPTRFPQMMPTPTPSAGVSSAPRVPVQAYAWNQSGSVDWFRFNMFMERLFYQYSFMGAYDSAWRYAQGDTFLTPQVVMLALREPSQHTALLLRYSEQLQGLIRSYEAGELDRSTFTASSRDTAKEIRRLAGKIRKDPYLDYLDVNSKAAEPAYESPDSLRTLALMAEELATTAAQIDGNLRSMVNPGENRVVAVDSLQQPSFESLSKRIDRMARLIEKSVTKL